MMVLVESPRCGAHEREGGWEMVSQMKYRIVKRVRPPKRKSLHDTLPHCTASSVHHTLQFLFLSLQLLCGTIKKGAHDCCTDQSSNNTHLLKDHVAPSVRELVQKVFPDSFSRGLEPLLAATFQLSQGFPLQKIVKGETSTPCAKNLQTQRCESCVSFDKICGVPSWSAAAGKNTRHCRVTLTSCVLHTTVANMLCEAPAVVCAITVPPGSSQ